MDYKQKYLKYKNKYINLKNTLYGGNITLEFIRVIESYLNNYIKESNHIVNKNKSNEYLNDINIILEKIKDIKNINYGDYEDVKKVFYDINKLTEDQKNKIKEIDMFTRCDAVFTQPSEYSCPEIYK